MVFFSSAFFTETILFFLQRSSNFETDSKAELFNYCFSWCTNSSPAIPSCQASITANEKDLTTSRDQLSLGQIWTEALAGRTESGLWGHVNYGFLLKK